MRSLASDGPQEGPLRTLILSRTPTNVLACLRDSATARTLGIDTGHLVIAGHSIGGWIATLITAVRAKGTSVTLVPEPTDHSWSDKRIALESAVLQRLAGVPPSVISH